MASIPFLGAARFQGFWNASTNAGTGSGLVGSAPGTAYSTLLVNGGYGGTTNLTASSGDYWQVTGSGTTNIDSTNQWALNDWVIYSGSSWIKLAFEDTIASIILGDMSTSVFHLGAANDKHIIFNYGSQHSGSSNFLYDYNNDVVSSSADIKLLASSAGSGAEIAWHQPGQTGKVRIYTTENDSGTDSIHISSSYMTKFKAGGLGYGFDLAGQSDVFRIYKIGAERSLRVRDDIKFYFGDGNDAYISYRETDDNYLVISGSSEGMVLSGSNVIIDGVLQGASPLQVTGNIGVNTAGAAQAYTFDVTGSLGVSGSGYIGGDLTVEGSILGQTMGGANKLSLTKNELVPAGTAKVFYGPLTLPDVQVATGGSGYSDSRCISVSGGSGSDMTVSITTSEGKIISATICESGTGYASPDTVTVSGGAGGTLIVNTTTSLSIAEAAAAIIQDLPL